MPTFFLFVMAIAGILVSVAVGRAVAVHASFLMATR
jgi:hypothetical protein